MDRRKQEKLRRVLDAYRVSSGRLHPALPDRRAALRLDSSLRPRHCEHIRDAVQGS